MKVAIVTSSFPLEPDDPSSAAGLFVRDFAAALSLCVDEVHVLTQDKGYGSKIDDAPFNVHLYPWGGGKKALSQLRLFNPLDLLSAVGLLRNAYQSLKQLHDSVKLDHVLAMWAVPAGLTALKLFKNQGVPYSAWCLGSDIWTYGKIPVLSSQVRRVLRSAQGRYADGMQLGRDASKLASLPVDFLPSSRRLPVNNYEPQPLDDSRKPKFLFVGRYARVKGIDVLLAAMAKYRGSGGQGSLYIFGGGPCEMEIRNQVVELNLSDCVSVGALANVETVIRYAKSCDAFVIPSRNESIPVILSDALQLGKPVIVSDVGDMGRIVSEAIAGIVVPAENSSALANAMTEFAASLERSPSNYQAGVSSLAKKFDVLNSARKFAKDIGATFESNDATHSRGAE